MVSEAEKKGTEKRRTESGKSAEEASRINPLQIRALVMTYLVLSLLFTTPLSMAVLTPEISGSDGVKGYRKQNDSSYVDVLADSNVTLESSGGEGLDLNCNNQSGIFKCSYTFPEEEMTPGAYTYTFSQESGTPSTEDYELVVDGEAPSITSWNTEIINNTQIKVDYEVKDKASPTLDRGVGLDYLDLYVGGSPVKTEYFEEGVKTTSGSFKASITGINGEKTVRLVAYDLLGNSETSNNKTVNFDTSKPLIGNEFSLRKDGEPLQKISTQSAKTVKADVVFIVDEENLVKVTGDLSGLNQDPVYQDTYSSLTASCKGSGVRKNCTFAGIVLNPDSSDLKINVTAKDSSGNKVNKVLHGNVEIVNEKPVVKYIGRESGCEDCYLRTGVNSLVTRINTVTSMSESNVNLALEGERAKGRCKEEGAEWVCKFLVPLEDADHGSKKTVNIGSLSTDDIGNPLKGEMEKDFTVDNNKPALVKEVKMDNKCPVAGDTLTVEATLRDYSGVKVSADISEITDLNETTGSCEEKEENTFECDLKISSFLPNHKTGEMEIIFEDLAENKLKIKKQVEVCEADTTTEPNFISSLDPKNVPKVDKRVASLTPFKVVVPLKVKKNFGSAEIMKIVDKECSATNYLGEKPYILNEYEPEKPVMVVGVGGNPEVFPKKIPLNCSITFKMRRGNTVYQIPEREPLNLKLPTYNLEMGNIGQGIKNKIDNIKKTVREEDDKIEDLEKIDEILGKLCKVVEGLNNANQVLQAVKSVVYPIALALQVWGNAGQALWSAVSGFLDSFHGMVTKYIWPPGWAPEGGMESIGYIVKYTCTIYTCKLYEASTYIDIGLQSFGSNEIVTEELEFEMLEFEIPTEVSSTKPETNVVAEAVGGNEWIINPYRNAKYDYLCIPAQIYNHEKEKQINCLKGKCIKKAAKKGLPISMCEEQYKQNNCLYVQGARSKGLPDNKILGLLEAASTALLSNLVGIGTAMSYKSLCKDYYYGTASARCQNLNEAGWKCVVCGLTGTALSLSELAKIYNNLYSEDRKLSTDYCKGFNYKK